MNLFVALGAIGVTSTLQSRTVSDVPQQLCMIGPERAGPVAGMAPEAEKVRWLPQQVVCHGSVWFMADRTVLGDRRMLIGKWTLLLRMAPPAHHVDCRA